MLRFAAAGAVGAYQRHVSPHKGFCCAYRVHTGRASCSEFGRRVLLRLGILAFFRLMPRQFARCRAAFAALSARRERKGKRARERECAARRCDGNCADCGNCGDCTPDGCDAPCDCSI